MDNKEQTSAANALIEWFNHQEISSTHAEGVMRKVLAKIMISKASDTIEMRRNYDNFVSLLANDMNDRAFQVLHGKRK